MSERAEGFYWVRVLEYPPEVAHWDGDMWWVAGSVSGFVPGAVAVLSPRLVPPWPDTPVSPPPPAPPVPRVAVRWAVPPCGGEADTAGVLFGGGR